MQKNLSVYERTIRFILGGIFLFTGMVLFQHPFAMAIAVIAGLIEIAEALFSRCLLFSLLGVRTIADALSSEIRYLIGIAAIQLVIAYEWWTAGIEKVAHVSFVNGIAKTLGYFASANPFPWYKEFLLGFAMQNATPFAYLIEFGEVATGVALAFASCWHIVARSECQKRISACIIALCLISGIIMNANFYLAAGWTGAGTHGVNVIMFWTQAILLYVWLPRLMKHT